MPTSQNRNSFKLIDYGFSIVQIETMLACNMQCSYCAYPLIKSKGGKLSDADIYKIIDLLEGQDESLDYISFNQYSEPLLDERIYDFIAYAKKRKLKVKLITNGLLLKDGNVRAKLIAADPAYIKISLETLNADTFNKVRGISSSFESYKKGIIDFLVSSDNNEGSAKIIVDVACNFLSKNDLLIRRTLGLEHGDPSVPQSTDDIEADFVAFLDELQSCNPRFLIDKTKARDYLRNLNKNYLDQQEFAISPNISFKVKQFIFGRRLSEFYPAYKAGGCETRILAILGSGSVVPCCLAYDNILSLGNIKEEDLPRILERGDSLIKNIRSGKNLPDICRICKGAPSKRGAIALSLRRKFS